MKRFIIVLSLGLIGAMAAAQNISNSVRRDMNLALLETIGRLEKISVLSDPAMVDEYVSMFRDPHQMVFNDLIGGPGEDMLPLHEYVEEVGRMSDVSVVFSDVVKSKPYIAAGSICVDVTFDKSISYRDTRSVFYSSEEFHGSPYRIKVVFSYDDFDGTCLIESLTGCVDSCRDSGEEYLVCRAREDNKGIMFRNPDVPARKGYYKKEECSPVGFDSYGQAFMPASVTQEDWYYMQDVSEGWDPDVHLDVTASSGGFVYFDAKKNPFRVKVYNSAAAAGAFAIEGSADRKVSFSDEIGVEMRYMFDLGHRFNAGIYGSLGVAYNYVDVAVNDMSYVYVQTLEKKHSYVFDVIGQRYHMADGLLSGGLAFEYAIARRWNVDFKLGAKAYYNLWSEVGDMYCDYKALYAGSKETVHLKGHFREETIVNKVEFKPDVWPCPFSVEAGAGLSYSISKSMMFSFGLEYEQGLNYYYQAPLKGESLVDYKSYRKPIAYSEELGYDVAYRSMTDTFHLKRKAIWVDFGLVFRF